MAKKIILITLLISLTIFNQTRAQEQPGEWPDKMSSISGYAVLGPGAHMNFSHDCLKKGDKTFYGFTGRIEHRWPGIWRRNPV